MIDTCPVKQIYRDTLGDCRITGTRSEFGIGMASLETCSHTHAVEVAARNHHLDTGRRIQVDAPELMGRTVLTDVHQSDLYPFMADGVDVGHSQLQSPVLLRIIGRSQLHPFVDDSHIADAGQLYSLAGFCRHIQDGGKLKPFQTISSHVHQSCKMDTFLQAGSDVCQSRQLYP